MKVSILINIIIIIISFQAIKAQTQQPILRLNMEMHNDDILDINIEAKGKYVLTTSLDKTAKLWDAQTGNLIKTYRFKIGKGNEGELYAGAISPNSKIIAITGITGEIKNRLIYIFNTITGKLIQQISIHNNIGIDLEFSKNGKYLAVANNGGVLIFKTNLSEIDELNSLRIEKLKTLTGYKNPVKNIAFSSSGKFASVCYDGKIRLYDSNFSLINETTGSGNKPYTIAFSPDGNKIAVGYLDVPEIEVRSANNLQVLYKPPLDGITTAGAFMHVAFSADGKYLYGAGNYSEYSYSSRYWVYRKWLNQGKGSYQDYRATGLNYSDIKPITNSYNKGSDLIYASYTSWGRAEPESPLYDKSSKKGSFLYKKQVKMNDFNVLGNRLYLRINNAGDKISFKPWYKNNVVFSVKDRKLYETNNISNMPTYRTSSMGIKITDWQKSKNPLLNNQRLPTWSEEVCKAVDVDDNGTKALFCTKNYVFCYNSKREIEWEEYSNTDICQINMSGNGKIFIAALTNGIINWYKMDDIVSFKIESVTKGGIADISGLKPGDIVLDVNGKEFKSGVDFSLYIKEKKLYNFKVKRGNDILSIKLNKTGNSFGFSHFAGKSQKRLLFSLYTHPNNKDWILFSPEGYFDCSQGAENFVGWHINQGYNKEAKFYPLSQFYEKFYIPNLGTRLLNGERITNNVNIKNLKLPPKVKIISPTNDGELRGFKIVKGKTLKSEKKEINITVKATDQGGGINEIRLYQNGKLVNSTERVNRATETVGLEQTKTFTISLTNGKNIIKATAFNNQRSESIADVVTIEYDGIHSPANLYMLVIGINNYKNPRYKLNYALADALAFKTQLEKGSSTIFGKTEVVYLTDSKASKELITQAFKQISAKTKATDVFVFYYAGHGVMSEEEESMFYIIPYDVTQLYGNNGMLKTKGVSAKQLQEFSKVIKAQKQLFVLDACQSGGMVEHLSKRGVAEEKAIAQLARSTGSFWLTASGSEQFASEFPKLGHGLFTYTILQALKGDADGSSNDKKITVKEISAYLNDIVPELSKKYKGSAQYPTSYGFGNDFPLVIIK